MHNNWLKIEWDKNFSIIVIHNNNTVMSGEAIWVLKIVENLVGRVSARTPLGAAHRARSTEPLSDGEGVCYHLPKSPTPLSAFGLDFRPFGPHSAASLTVCISPNA